MKFLIVISLLLSSSVFAAEKLIVDTKVSGSFPGDRVESRFVVDETTGEGSVTVKVTKIHTQKPGGPSSYHVIFNKNFPVEGLSLHADRLVFAAEAGDVLCGTMKKSRILGIKRMKLSGNCKLSNKLSKKQLTVKLITK